MPMEIRSSKSDGAAAVRDYANVCMLAACEEFTHKTGASGLSFMTIVMGMWSIQLTDIDKQSTQDMLEALAVIVSPSASVDEKEAAEKKRHEAVNKLFMIFDLKMAEPEGTG